MDNVARGSVRRRIFSSNSAIRAVTLGECVITSDDEDSYADFFDYICGENEKYCNGIARNATTSKFGSYSGCNPKDQLGYVANQYYLGQSKAASACSFSGKAKTQSAATASSCKALLSEVRTAGTSTVPSATRKGTAAASSSSKAAAPSLNASGFFESGALVFGAYVTLAVGSLVGMLVL